MDSSTTCTRASCAKWHNARAVPRPPSAIRFVDPGGTPVIAVARNPGVMRDWFARMNRWGYVIIRPDPRDIRPDSRKRDWIVRLREGGELAREAAARAAPACEPASLSARDPSRRLPGRQLRVRRARARFSTPANSSTFVLKPGAQVPITNVFQVAARRSSVRAGFDIGWWPRTWGAGSWRALRKDPCLRAAPGLSGRGRGRTLGASSGGSWPA